MTRVHLLAISALALGLLIPGSPAEATDPSDPDWPCIQRKIPEISAGMMWVGPALPDDDKLWQKDDNLAAEVTVLSLRRLPIEEAQSRIDAWSAGLTQDKNRKLTLLFAGLLQTINAERAEIVDGIERYTRRQRALADKVRAMRATLGERQSDNSQGGEAQSGDQLAEIQSLEETLAWEVRIFQEREESLSYVCESPVILEQRLFALARHIMTHLED